MAEGNDTSHLTSDASAIAAIAKPGGLNPAITEMIEGPKIASPAIQPEIEPPQPELPLTIATTAAPAAPAPPDVAAIPSAFKTETPRVETPQIEPKIPSDATRDEVEF